MGIYIVCTLSMTGNTIGALIKLQNANNYPDELANLGIENL